MGSLPCGAVAALAVALLSQPGDRWKAIRAAWPVGCLRSANFPDSWAAPFCLDDLVVGLVHYADVELRLTHVVPGSAAANQTVAEGSALQRPLWSLAAQAIHKQPVATAPRLYEDSLNAMIDEQTVSVAGLSNRVPTEVLLLEIIGAAIALALLGLHVGVLGRGMVAVLLAAAVVSMLLYVIFDLDRPTRGLIQVPDAPIAQLQASMKLPAAAGSPP